MNFFFIGNLFNSASFSSFLDNKILYFRYGTLNKRRQRFLRFASIGRGGSLMRKPNATLILKRSFFFHRRSFFMRFSLLIGKYMRKKGYLYSL